MTALIIVALTICGIVFSINGAGVILGDSDEKVYCGGHCLVLAFVIVVLSIVLGRS